MILPFPRRVLLAYALTIAAVLAIVIGFHFHRGTGLTSLIRFGEIHQAKLAPELADVPVHLIPGHHGYDGQFYAHAALHPPWLHHDLLEHYDAPAYRARRILLPAVAFALGLGQPAWIVHIYSILNLIAWLGLAVVLSIMLPPLHWINYGRWAGCMLAAGNLESLRASLTDLPALLLAVVALHLFETRRAGASAGVFALSILTRETFVLSAMGTLWPRNFRPATVARSIGLGCLALFPLGLWIHYLSLHFPSAAGSDQIFSWPFLGMADGIADASTHIARGERDNGRFVFRLLTVGAMAIQFGVILRGRLRDPAWFRFCWPFLLFFPFLGPLLWEAPWTIWRTELPVTLAFCFLVPTGRWFWPLLLAGSVGTLHAAFRLAF